MRIPFLMAVLAAGVAPAFGGEKLAAKQIGSRIDVTVGNVFFTSYRSSAEEKYPFFFPVNGPSGGSVTSMRNGIYPHHSSLFFGCDRVNGGNYWQEGIDRGQILSEGAKVVEASGERVVINEQCRWVRKGAESPFRDTRTIIITAPSAHLRLIDLSITLEALLDVEILKTNHSLLTVRLDPDLAVKSGGWMVNAEGKSGQSGTHGVASPWMAAWGRRGNGPTEGIAILQDPVNPGYPTKWLTRDYGLFSPTEYQFPPDGKSIKYAKGTKLAFRYLVAVFEGTPETAGIARLMAADGCRETPDGAELVKGGRTVWAFHVTNPECKPFIHPLTLPDGRVATDLRPTDHPWHLGCFFCWKFINGVNYWEPAQKGGVLPAGETKLLERKVAVSGESAKVSLKLAYAPRQTSAETVLTEEREVDFSAPDSNGCYSVTSRHRFTAVREAALERTPPYVHGKGADAVWAGGYAGFAVRINPIFKAFKTSSSCGETAQKPVMDREKRWLDFSDPANGHGLKVEVLKGTPETRFYHWVDRRFICPAPNNAAALHLKAGETLELAYRVDIH